MGELIKQANVAFLVLAALALEGSLEITWFITLYPYLIAGIWYVLHQLADHYFDLSGESEIFDIETIHKILNGLFENAGVAESVLSNYCKQPCSEERGKSDACSTCEHMRAHEFFRIMNGLGTKLKTRDSFRSGDQNG